MNKTAYIYIGAEICADRIEERPEDGDLVIAADSGYNNAKTLGVKVDILLGDMDSIGEAYDLVPQDTEIIKLPPEKDDTDTSLAVKLALERGCDNIVIIGGLSGRLDHTMANLYSNGSQV